MEHEAGPQLDALVAEKVMGWRVFRLEQAMHDGNTPRPHCVYMPTPDGEALQVFRESGDLDWWQPSTKIEAAWEVVEKLKIVVVPITTGGWIARAGMDIPRDGDEIWTGGTGWSDADTAPLAICRAALRAQES